MAEKDDENPSDSPTVKPDPSGAVEKEASPDELLQRLGLVNKAINVAANPSIPHSNDDNVEPFIRPELDEATTVDLLAKCAELFPDQADKLPSFLGLKALVTRLVNGWESVLKLDKGLSNKRYTQGERHTLISAAESIGEPEFIADLFNTIHEMYARILSLAPLFKSKDFGDLINKEDFSLNQGNMNRIVDVVVELLMAYENLRVQANTHSTVLAKPIRHRQENHPGDSLDKDKSILMRAHRWNEMIVNLQAQGIFKAMKNGDIQRVTSDLAKVVETTFFVASEYMGMEFTPQIIRDTTGKFEFEKRSPLKADYLMYLMTTLFELLPALRVLMHVFSRIQKWDPRMAKLDQQRNETEASKLN